MAEKTIIPQSRKKQLSLASLAPVIDFVALAISLLASYALRFNFDIPREHLKLLCSVLPASTLVEIIILSLWGCYKITLRYLSNTDTIRFGFAATTSAVLLLLLRFINPGTLTFLHPPISIILINGFISTILIIAWRHLWRLSTFGSASNNNGTKRTLIVGTSTAANSIAYAIRHDKTSDHKIIGFLSEQSAQLGNEIQGFPIVGTIAEAEATITNYGIDELIIASPQLSHNAIEPLFKIACSTQTKLLIAPNFSHITENNDSTNELRQADIADILGKSPISVTSTFAVTTLLNQKTILITGAGGALGSSLAKEILSYNPQKLILLDRDENAIFSLMRAIPNTDSIVPIVSDVGNALRLNAIFSKYDIDLCIHTAAYNHIPIMENNALEAISNNTIATNTLFQIAKAHKTRNFLFLSTNAASTATSTIGLTKRAAELLITANPGPVVTTIIRFGNVIGSTNSVIPIFQEQIKKHEPITITSPEMTRHFITIKEATTLSLEATTLGNGIFTIDMGEPINITTLAQNLVKLSGLRPNIDIPITYTGLRDGEEFQESNYLPTQLKPTSHPRIHGIAQSPNKASTEKFNKLLKAIADQDEATAKEQLLNLVKESN